MEQIVCSHCRQKVQAMYDDPVRKKVLVASAHTLMPAQGGSKEHAERCPGSYQGPKIRDTEVRKTAIR